MGLQISIRETRDVVILDLQGRLSTREDGELLSLRLRSLIDNGKNKLLLNLVNLVQIDSSGVSIIARTQSSLKRRGGNLGLLRPGGHVLEVFKVLRLLKVIPCFEDENQAVTSFRLLDLSQSPEVREGTTLFR